MHNVLDPNGTSVDVAGGRAGRRGPKTCLQESRTWNQLAPCGLRPGPLAFSCMAMTLHTGEALALIPAMQTPFWWATATSLSQVSCRHSWGVLYASMSAEQALADLGTSPGQ